MNIIRNALILAIVLSFPAAAQEEAAYIPPVIAAAPYGLAMHGAPKYGADSTHLDYANPDAPKGGTLKQAAIGTFDTLNPFSIKGKAAEGLDGLFYTRLMGRVWDEPFSLYPLIAESYEMPEDRSSITFTLNPKAAFHDGTKILAQDVLFSFETMKEKGRPNQRQVYRLATAEILSPRAIKFSFGEGYDQETALIFAIMPVLSKKWWEGRDFEATLLEPPASTGAYTIASVEPGRQIVFQRVKDHWAQDFLVNKGHNNFDRIVFDYYRDSDVALEAFKSGDLNFRREWDAGAWSGNYTDLPASAGVTLEELSTAAPTACALLSITRGARPSMISLSARHSP